MNSSSGYCSSGRFQKRLFQWGFVFGFACENQKPDTFLAVVVATALAEAVLTLPTLPLVLRTPTGSFPRMEEPAVFDVPRTFIITPDALLARIGDW
jgi:hypothetical protein